MANEVAIEELLQCVCFRMRKATRRFAQLYDHALQPFGVTGPQFSLLAHLPRGRQIPVGQLADELGTEASTLTRNLRPLERRGLLSLIEAPYDRRVKLALSTRAGQELFSKAIPAWRAARAQLEEEIDAAALRQLEEALDKL
jgi:DNA-binding MarR family transcriptional regulator